MKKLLLLLILAISLPLQAEIAVPGNLVLDSVPAIPEALAERVSPYLDFRTASFNSWHPERREMIISTRFGNTPQLHLVRFPGAAREQITFFADRVLGGSWQPKIGKYITFVKDIGGGEFYQIYRFDPATGQIVLLTDGKSRNEGGAWATSGKSLAYSSTRRNGTDSDIYVVDVDDPKSDRKVLEVSGGGWNVEDWSPDDQRLLLGEYISVNESSLYLVDLASGAKRLLTPQGKVKAAFGSGEFAADGKSIYLVSDEGSEFLRLVRFDLASGKKTPLTAHINWNVEQFEVSPDGKTIAFVTNEAGIGVLHLLDVTTGKEIAAPKIPIGDVGSIELHENGRDLAFNLASADSPTDAYSVDITNGKLERWTKSETGGLNTEANVEPELVKLKSFDGLEISAFVYRPDGGRFPGKRPVMVSIHGGPEGQSTPGFIGRMNYLINEMGISIIYPNVRGSTGYGKTFLTLDNGFKREDTVKDIGAVLDWIASDSKLDKDRVLVYGGSYGGYMVLASMTHYSDRLRAAIDVVGISNFVTFLNNTQGYRRDLRRVEYGDERDAKMNAFLQKISPLTNASKIKKPLFVIQGFNDPRVPYTEAEQIVKAVRNNNVPVWYMMAKDEGHGFAKKSNADYQFLAMILFLQEHLVK